MSMAVSDAFLVALLSHFEASQMKLGKPLLLSKNAIRKNILSLPKSCGEKLKKVA